MTPRADITRHYRNYRCITAIFNFAALSIDSPKRLHCWPIRRRRRRRRKREKSDGSKHDGGSEKDGRKQEEEEVIGKSTVR